MCRMKMMKRCVYLAAFLFCQNMSAQQIAPNDSVRIYFRQSIDTLDLNYRSNKEKLDLFSKRLLELKEHKVRFRNVQILSSASPEGPSRLNESLAKNRAEVLSNYIRNNVELSMVESQYANERYMSTAGVLQHGSRHVLVLVKRKQPGAPYEPVDWLFSACTPAIVKQLQTQALPDFSGNTNADWVFVSRKDGVMYPIAKRDNETFLHATKSHLPQNEAILYTGHTYQFYDWIYRFGEEPRNYRSQVLYNMTPGTRFYNRAVDNNGVWLPGFYNELGEMDKPNPTTGK